MSILTVVRGSLFFLSHKWMPAVILINVKVKGKIAQQRQVHAGVLCLKLICTQETKDTSGRGEASVTVKPVLHSVELRYGKVSSKLLFDE